MEWRSNVRILQCTDGTFVRPCKKCTHPFGEHNMLGDCMMCMRADQYCGTDMHDMWPDLVPVVA